ncbi:dehydratase [Gordonia sp. TBRC 11910]|uniref:Dehydratase n=1 Tax=Gordonia asplenii TaxID=2725283 RepID=A0A848KTD6_9ACTN|nr:MaoC/PaaZ C-terminal domain-containing protein [Gordonia asplenii]NMO01257.1 dehydratase [Gordonia asplenii]
MTAPLPTRPDGLWADDLAVGQTFISRTVDVSSDDIVEFAQRYDPQTFHLDDAAARGTFFDGLVGSGWHTAALTMRLFTEALPIATGIVGAGVDLTWPSAMVAGDVLHLEGTIDDITFSKSRPDRAIVVASHQTLNQHGEARQRSTARLLAWKRPD